MNFNPQPASPNIPITIQGDSFFPLLDLDVFVTQYRIPSELPRSMVENALIRAFGDTAGQLEYFKNNALKKGFKKLSDMDSIKVNNVSIFDIEFLRAVSCFAKAEIIRETPSVIRLKAAENSAKSAEETEDFYRELGHVALSKILGVSGRINVETI